MHRRAGLTLVETLTIVAVVGFLICIVLPALQSARGPDCRRLCRNNLRNLALAVNNYCIRENVFPVSTTEGPGGGPAHSWMALIMRDLDQPDIFDNYNFSVESYDPANRRIVDTTFSTLVCTDNPLPRDWLPSEQVRRADGRFYPAGAEYARSHYGANWGGGRLPGFGDDFASTYGNFRGVMMPVGVSTPRGVTKAIGPEDVVDGLGSTIMLGEKRDGQGWAVGGYGGSEFDVGLSPAPPDRPGGRYVVSGSFHAEGGSRANYAFADGSVRSLGMSTARPVWYALITRDGGEDVAREAIDRGDY